MTQPKTNCDERKLWFIIRHGTMITFSDRQTWETGLNLKSFHQDWSLDRKQQTALLLMLQSSFSRVLWSSLLLSVSGMLEGLRERKRDVLLYILPLKERGIGKTCNVASANNTVLQDYLIQIMLKTIRNSKDNVWHLRCNDFVTSTSFM